VDPITPPSLASPLLQAIVTLGLAALLAHLHRRHGKAHFKWWAIALLARVLSVAAIVTFMVTGREWLLYLHQVFLGWTAFGLLYAAEVFSRQLVWDRRYWLFVCFPVAWSAVASARKTTASPAASCTTRPRRSSPRSSSSSAC
jgi:predicted tellurium resistance membrane protein TerC